MISCTGWSVRGCSPPPASQSQCSRVAESGECSMAGALSHTTLASREQCIMADACAVYSRLLWLTSVISLTHIAASVTEMRSQHRVGRGARCRSIVGGTLPRCCMGPTSAYRGSCNGNRVFRVLKTLPLHVFGRHFMGSVGIIKRSFVMKNYVVGDGF